MYTAATATKIITKLKENGNSGIDGGGEVTVNCVEANKLIEFGLSEMEIVCGPSVVDGTGNEILIEPSEATLTESTRVLSKNT